MFRRVVWRAMQQRRQRVGLALAALTVAAALATTLLSLYSDIERKLRQQFRGYGANIVILPAGERRTISLAALAEAGRHGDAAPFLYSVQTVNDQPLVVAGVDYGRLEPLTRYWAVDGRRGAGPRECLVGARLAERFRLRAGSTIQVAGEQWRVAGIVSTGAAEDSQVLLPLEEVMRRSGSEGQVSAIHLRADSARVESARAALAVALPEAEVRVLRSAVEAEAGVILKIRGTLLGLLCVVLLITALCVMNNFAAVVHQRRREVGILKAIGGADSRIWRLFAAEVVLVGAAASLSGFAMGCWLADRLGRQIFHEPVPIRLEVLPAVLAITLLVALAATAAPLRRIRRIEPAVILRGE